MTEIIEFLDELFPNPRCELEYNKDYELLIAVMLSARTTDKRVNMVTNVLFSKYPDLKALNEAKLSDIERIIYPVGTHYKKAKYIKEICNSLYKDHNGVVPNDRAYLENLPGVGRKTANVVLANLFDEKCIAVDTHVSRVSVRLGFASKLDDVSVIEHKLNKKLDRNRLNRLHHQLVLFGRYYCTAKNPKCDNCLIKDMCKYIRKNTTK